MNNQPTIARLPTDSKLDEFCDICGDDTVVLVINGKPTKTQFNLCSTCCAKMKNEINAINDGLNIYL